MQCYGLQSPKRTDVLLIYYLYLMPYANLKDGSWAFCTVSLESFSSRPVANGTEVSVMRSCCAAQC